jgi:hypothetical protein
MICQLCNGMGSLFVRQLVLLDNGKARGENHWHTCQACGGAGATVMQGPAMRFYTLSGGQRKALSRAAK